MPAAASASPTEIEPAAELGDVIEPSAMGVTVRELLALSKRRLAAAPHQPSPREGSLLLGHVLGLDEARLLAHDRDEVDAESRRRFQALLERRLKGEPVAYLTGEREFYGRRFMVDRRVLIPRPETEHLVEAALRVSLPPAPRILDVGTGSGCVAVTLACELPESRLIATDSQPGALAVAATNAVRHGVRDRVRLICADLTTSLRLEAIDLVVTNPPYIAPGEASTLSPEITGYEPHAALFAAGDGTATFERLFRQLQALRPQTRVVVEIGADQASSVQKIGERHGLSFEELRTDYAGRDRIVVLTRRQG